MFSYLISWKRYVGKSNEQGGMLMRTSVIIFGALLTFAVATTDIPRISGVLFVPQAVAAEQGNTSGGMTRVRLILRKLQDAMASMKDLDALQKSGMPKKDVDRMRRAMQLKINQMMEDAIADIRAL